jgi:hypothetical protein
MLLDPLCGERVTTHTSEGAHMRKVMEEFDQLKKNFNGEGGVLRIRLPTPLKNITISGHIDEGLLSITK